MNLKEINAFALPGGPMFVHRGMFDAAAAEGEVVGVMAHELSHVLLRHGTANASKAQNPWLQLGQLAGAIGGAVVGGRRRSRSRRAASSGSAPAAEVQPRLRKAGRPARRADHGARRLRSAALARMFETIERESKSSGGSGPQWMSSHPNPGNRTRTSPRKRSMLTHGTPADESDFAADQGRVRGACRRQSRWPSSSAQGRIGRRQQASIGRHARAAGAGAVVAVSGASTAEGLSGGRSVQLDQRVVEQLDQGRPAERLRSAERPDRVQPRRRVRRREGRVARPAGGDERLAAGRRRRAIPSSALAGPQQAIRISQRSAIATPLVNPSPLGGQERIGLYTTFLADGSLFYYLTIVPEGEAQNYREAFRRIGESLRLTEVQ